MRIMNAKEKTAIDQLLYAAGGDSVAVAHAMREASKKTGHASLSEVLRILEEEAPKPEKQAVAG